MRWNFSARRNLPIAVAIGVLLVVIIVKLNASMQHQVVTDDGQLAHYQLLKQQAIRPEIVGFGRVEPNVQFNGIAEVSGKITYMHPALKKGELFEQGTLLLSIDDSDYQLQLAKANANLATAQVQLAAKKTAQLNNALDIKLSRNKLQIAQSEYDRLARLLKQKSISQNDLDRAQQQVLLQQQDLQRNENAKSLLPLEIKALQAGVNKAEADVKQAQLAIERTQVRLPFTGRIHKVNVEQSQWVTMGMPIFSASDVAQVQINAQFTFDSFHQFTGFFKRPPNINTVSAQGMAAYFAEQGLQAQVELLGHEGMRWPAKIARMSDEIDPQSQTVGVVVTIDDSYKNIELANKPPLLAGMRAKVSLLATEQNFIAVPRAAVKGRYAILADAQNRLQKLDTQGALKQQNYFLFKDENLLGAKLITTDLFPVIAGSKLQLVPEHTAVAASSVKEPQ
ncbi:efflux RND transporter periplasmic adaptor subunit [Pseudoalteromonas phenolica]|uniref:efflux RND transporter periplasmic adaptor subunit n=1 Tax=Pseudoalteromonas phenolica TaxID=161398 RepID=UPI00384D0092